MSNVQLLRDKIKKTKKINSQSLEDTHASRYILQDFFLRSSQARKPRRICSVWSRTMSDSLTDRGNWALSHLKIATARLILKPLSSSPPSCYGYSGGSRRRRRRRRKVQSIRQSSTWEVVTASVLLLIIKSQFANEINHLSDCFPLPKASHVMSWQAWHNI